MGTCSLLPFAELGGTLLTRLGSFSSGFRDKVQGLTGRSRWERGKLAAALRAIRHFFVVSFVAQLRFPLKVMETIAAEVLQRRRTGNTVLFQVMIPLEWRFLVH